MATNGTEDPPGSRTAYSSSRSSPPTPRPGSRAISGRVGSAAKRAQAIASGVAFILPIVIDDTREPQHWYRIVFEMDAAARQRVTPGCNSAPEAMVASHGSAQPNVRSAETSGGILPSRPVSCRPRLAAICSPTWSVTAADATRRKRYARAGEGGFCRNARPLHRSWRRSAQLDGDACSYVSECGAGGDLCPADQSNLASTAPPCLRSRRWNTHGCPYRRRDSAG